MSRCTPKEIANNENLLNTRQAADALDKSRDSISSYCRSGELEAEKIKGAWAIPKSSIKKFREKRNEVKYRNDWEASEEQIEEMKTVLLDLIQANQNKRALYRRG